MKITMAVAGVLLCLMVIPSYSLAQSGLTADICDMYSANEAIPSGHPIEHVNHAHQLEGSGDLRGAVMEYCRAFRLNPNAFTASRDLMNLITEIGGVSLLKAAKQCDLRTVPRLEMLGLTVEEQPTRLTMTVGGRTRTIPAYSVREVQSDRAAGQHGMLIGDRIVALRLNGQEIYFHVESLACWLSVGRGGEEVLVYYFRAPDPKIKTVKLMLPTTPAEQKAEEEAKRQSALQEEETRREYEESIRQQAAERERERLQHLAAEEEKRQRAEAEVSRKEQERQQQRVAAEEAATAERRTHEEKAVAVEAERHTKFQTLLRRHHATDLSDMTEAVAFLKNPYAYQGKKVMLQGAYEQHIGRGRAIVNLVAPALATPHFVQWDTERNLAELAIKKTPFVRCVVNVLGTTVVTQGLISLTIPHVKEVECLP